MAVLIASSLRKELSGDPLFDRVSFKVERGDRVALAGPNGAGKTTLLRMLVGETGIDGGTLAWEKGARVALHDQRPPLDRALTLREYILTGAADLVATENELGGLEQAMAGGAHDATTLDAYARAQARLEHAGGYLWRNRADQALRGLGFLDADLGRRLSTFSGGELTRASLARTLAGDPDLLLLDEPTNHLDITSLEWLEKELTGLDAAIVLVAHDRWFLEAVATATMELEAGRATFFAGPWHAWRLEKEQRLGHAEKTAERIGRDIDRLQRFVDRYRASTAKKARQAQTKMTQIARLEKKRSGARDEIALLTRRTKSLGFEFLDPPRSGKTVVEIEDVSVSAGDKHLLDGVTFAIDRGEHIALVGPNGSGKTTLIGGLLSEEPPERGKVRLGYGVVPGYFSQHAIGLDERGSVLDCVQTMTGMTRPRAQNLLGRFLFSGWEAHEKPVTALSGGERRRLALAVLVASGSNFLVLDEPTNHLDLESREALEAALEAFPGTILLVSHDRALLDAVADRTAAIEDGTIHLYDGGWADYVRVREERAAAEQAASSAAEERPPRPKATRTPAKRPARPRRERDPIAEIEARIEAQEKLVGDLESRLAEDWADVDAIEAHKRAREDLAGLIHRWETLVDEVAR